MDETDDDAGSCDCKTGFEIVCRLIIYIKDRGRNKIEAVWSDVLIYDTVLSPVTRFSRANNSVAVYRIYSKGNIFYLKHFVLIYLITQQEK